MCIVQLPPGGNPLAVNNIYHIISYHLLINVSCDTTPCRLVKMCILGSLLLQSSGSKQYKNTRTTFVILFIKLYQLYNYVMLDITVNDKPRVTLIHRSNVS
jgi:hypothetical protein